ATAEKEHWKSKARDRDGWTVVVAIDPRNPKVMFLCDEDQKIIEPCWLEARSRSYEKYNWYEIRDYMAVQGVISAQEEDEILDYNIQYAETRQSIIESAPKPNFADMSKREATANIRPNRQEEKDFE